MCGITGMKPTYGRVSRRGVAPLAFSLDHIGPMTRTVRDNALMLQVIAGHDPCDPGSADEPVPDYGALLGQDVRGLRIGVIRHFYTKDIVGHPFGEAVLYRVAQFYEDATGWTKRHPPELSDQGVLAMLENREGGCHCGRVRFRAQVDLDLLSQCNCTVCTKKGILHLPVAPENFELLRGKNSLTTYSFGTGEAQHTFCSHCGMHAFYVPRSQPDSITVNARCLDDIDGPSLKPARFFDGRHWEEAQRKRIAEGGHVAVAGLNGAVTLRSILERALE